MRSRGAGLVALISVLALAAPAGGQEPGELSSSPSVNQYVESVPTAKGSRPAAAPGKPRGGELPPAVRRRVRAQGGADAETLEAIATQMELGAPPSGGARRRPSGASARAGKGAAAPAPADRRSPIPAAVEATFDSGSGSMTFLLLGLLATTVAVGVAAARRRSTTG